MARGDPVTGGDLLGARQGDADLHGFAHIREQVRIGNPAGLAHCAFTLDGGPGTIFTTTVKEIASLGTPGPYRRLLVVTSKQYVPAGRSGLWAEFLPPWAVKVPVTLASVS